MTIHLPSELAQFIRDVVASGRYSREDDVIRDAVFRLKQSLQEGAETVNQGAEPRQGKPLTKQEFQRHLTEIGLINQPAQTTVPPVEPSDELFDQEGEVVSERVIRERLIEWLAGFIGK